MINNIQFLRGFAALGVVYFHTSFKINGVNTDFWGVAIFFVISGFIMTMLTKENPKKFLSRRLIRIVPLYWMVTLFCWIWLTIGLVNPPYTWPVLLHYGLHEPWQIASWIRIHFLNQESGWLGILVRSLLFIPSQNHAGDWQPYLAVGWTLNLEMFFYLVFSVFIYFNRTLAPFGVACTLIGLRGVDELLKPGGIFGFYAQPYVMQFVLGIALYYIYSHIQWQLITPYRTLVIVIAVCFVGVFFAWHLVLEVRNNPLLSMIYFSFTGSAFLVFIALSLNRIGVFANHPLPLAIGNSSYSLYLTHLLVLETIRPVTEAWGILKYSNDFFSMLFVISISIAIGLIVYRYIEIPIIHGLKKRFAA